MKRRFASTPRRLARHSALAEPQSRWFVSLIAGAICCSILLGALGSPAAAQQTSVAALGLPDAPGYRTLEGGGQTVAEGSSSIGGTVLDANGRPFEGASVTVIRTGDRGERVVQSDANGQFLIGNLPAGRFTLTIASPGMQTFVSPEIPLHDTEKHQLPQIVLGIAGTTQQVSVTVSQVEIAQEEVKEQEKQRAFGVLPNFYSSYIWDAAPLDTRQKFGLALHSLTDPVSFIAVGAIAGAEQYENTFPAYGQGASGYAKRYGATFADNADGRMLGSAVFPSLFHQDPRYFYKGSGTIRSRILYAITRAIVTRGDNGKTQPNYSSVLGSFVAGAISNAYHPAADRGVGLTISNGFIDTAGNAADGLIREFLLRKVTTNVPDYKSGQPPAK